MGRPMCVIAYADAGKACIDKSDCQGECEASDDVGARLMDKKTEPKDEAGVGRCAPDNIPFGCHTYVENGAVTGTICVD